MKPRKNRTQKSADRAAAKKAAAPEKIEEYPVSVYHAGVESLVFPTARVSFTDPQSGLYAQTNTPFQNGYYVQSNANQSGGFYFPPSAGSGAYARSNTANEGYSQLSPLIFLKAQDGFFPPAARKPLGETLKPPPKSHCHSGNGEDFPRSSVRKNRLNPPLLTKTRFHDGGNEKLLSASSIKNGFNPSAPKPHFHSGKDDDFLVSSLYSLKKNGFNSPLAPRERIEEDGYKYQIPLLEEVGISGQEYAPIPPLSTLKTNAFNSPPSVRTETQREYNSPVPSLLTLKTNEFNSPIPRLLKTNAGGQYGSPVPSLSTLKTNEFNSPLPRLSRTSRKTEYNSPIPPLSTLRTNEFNSPLPRLLNVKKESNPPVSSIISTLQAFNSPIPPLSATRSQSEFDSPIPPLSSVRADASPEDFVSMRFAGGQRSTVRLPHRERQYYGPYVVEGDALPDEPQEVVKPVPKIFTLIKHKPVIYNEFAMIFALFALAFGKALILKADFGVTAVQSIPYLLSMYFGGFSLGTWNLIIQGAYVLAAVLLSQKIKLRYLFAIVITLVYVFLLDVFIDWSSGIVIDGMNGRIICFAAGYFLSALSITFFFKGNMPLMPYETLEKEIAAKRKTSVIWVKIILDIAFSAAATGLSFLLFGKIKTEALGIGTLIVMLTMSFAAAGINFVLNIFFTFRNLFLKAPKKQEDLGGFIIYSDI
jgi:uncharacterized membrane protein YczE